MRAVDWLPYQRKTFNTPAFPGYISGHSTFSRSAAEVLTAITGTPFFPGGLASFTANANAYLVFERGPTQTTTLQWATYYDAADLAGQSRRWGGIHVREDDYKGRIIGSQSGKQVWKLAQRYWDGSILTEDVSPTLGFQPGGGVVIKAPCRRGLYYHLEGTTDLTNWTVIGSEILATDSVIKFSDPSANGTPKFYRVVWVAK